jgi:hypothetical protein
MRTQKTRSSAASACLLSVACLGVTLASSARTQETPTQPPRVKSSQPRPRVSMTPPMPDDSPVKPGVLAARAGDWATAARLLDAQDPSAMVPAEARRWRLTATNAAVRTGNLALLKRANANRDGILFADGRQILHAWEYAQVGRYDLAKAALKKISDPDRLDERSHRRYLALLAGMAEGTGDKKAEREYVTGLVEYLGAWKSDNCQSCHENPEKYGDDVTSLDVANHWIGKRFVAVLRRDGDAAKIRATAEKELAADAGDESARLRRAYALRAEGDEAGAVAEMRKLEWAAFPDRPFKQPDNDIRFPGPLPLEPAKRRPLAEFLPDNHVISASDYLKAGDFARCRAELAAVAPYTQLPPAQQLRVWSVERYLAKLEGKRDAETHAEAQVKTLLERHPELVSAEKRFP